MLNQHLSQPLQVQVKSNSHQNVPFHLIIEDPSQHIQSIEENTNFAQATVDASTRERLGGGPAFPFSILVPSSDKYLPVMKYKCGDGLRPVPIVSFPS